jgi:hypothetical protein
MRSRRTNDPETPRLQPAGRRWGFGAHTVMPYLAHAAAPDPSAADASIRNPVFPHMEHGLRAMRRSH